MNEKITILVVSLVLSACSITTTSLTTTQPTLADYKAGEKWVWKYKGETSEGEIRADGTDTKEVKNVNGILSMVSGNQSTPLSEIVKPEESETPRFHWPLEVGKQWKFEQHWTSQDGTKGKTSYDAEVLSYNEETVEAGTFMAYTIRYSGKITNSRGYSANTEEIFLYAPKVKSFIKLTQTQDSYLYVEELSEYYVP